jgi:O-acetyl-ADP-ribose deacetylase (regulator of RNase III)
MLEYRLGNLLEAEVEALVNTVNCVGVMGKGVALQFKKAFPENFAFYRMACERGDVVPGRMFLFPTAQLTGPEFIINFPTKRHWRDKSRIEDVETGLNDLRAVIEKNDIKSVALPALGCGNGGLNWDDVQPLIEHKLGPVQNVLLQVYLPTPRSSAVFVPLR